MALVAVIDSEGKLVEWVQPAVARQALKIGAATIWQQDPFTLQLAQGLSETPKPEGRTSEDRKMTKTWASMLPSERVRAITEFFNTPQDDIWIKATGATNVVLTVKVNGQLLPIPTIKVGDPVLLSEFMTFDDLKKSTGDLRKFIEKGFIKLLTHDEAQAYFEAKAARLGTTVSKLMNNRGDDVRQNAVTMHGMRVVKTEGSPSDLPEEPSSLNPKLAKPSVDPKVIHLCRQGAADMPEDQRKPAKELYDDFLAIEDSLKESDFDYIFSNMVTEGEYKTIRKWAKGHLSSTEAEAEEAVI